MFEYTYMHMYLHIHKEATKPIIVIYKDLYAILLYFMVRKVPGIFNMRYLSPTKNHDSIQYYYPLKVEVLNFIKFC